MRLKPINTIADVPERYRLAAAAAKGLGWSIQLRCTAAMQRIPEFEEYELWAQPPGESWLHFYPHDSITHAMKLADAMRARVASARRQSTCGTQWAMTTKSICARSSPCKTSAARSCSPPL